MDPPPAPYLAPAPASAPGRLAGRVGRHTAIYALVSVTGVVAGLLNVTVVTRLLPPQTFGRLTILLVIQTSLMLLYGLGSLQGTFAWVYGSTGDDDTGDEEDGGPVARDARRALTTGLAMTAAVGAIGTCIVAAVSRRAADGLMGDAGAAGLVILASASATVAAVWRLAGNALRLERRPWAYFATAAIQHLLGLALAIPLLAAGRGVGAVLVAFAAGNLGALGLALWLIRRSMRRALSWRDAKIIARRGRTLAPVVLSMHVIQVADVLILSQFVPSAQVGLYRIGNRIGSLVSYFTASFHMAWGPLRRDPAYLAAEAEHGVQRVAVVVSTYFMLFATGAVLAATLLEDTLIGLAAPSYAAAAPLIPLTATALAMHGVLVLVYRTGKFPSKRKWFVGATAASSVVFVGSCLILIPLTGPRGAALGAIAGWGVATLILLLRGQLGAHPVPFDWRRIGAGLLVAGACAAAGRLLGAGLGPRALGVDLVALAAYPVLLVALRIVPWAHVRGVAAVIRQRRRRRAPAAVGDDELIDELVRRRVSVAQVARDTGVSEDEVHRRLVSALRGTGAEHPGREWDAELGRHVLLEGGFLRREASARALYAAGADPLEVEALTRTADRLRTARRRAAPPAARTPPAGDPAPRPS